MASTITLKQVGPFAIDVHGSDWTFRIDLPVKDGGQASGPGPTDLVPAALAACEMMLALLTAKRNGHPLTGVEATVNKTYQANPSRLGDMTVKLQNVLTQLPPEIHERVKNAVATCPVLKTLEQPPKLYSELA